MFIPEYSYFLVLDSIISFFILFFTPKHFYGLTTSVDLSFVKLSWFLPFTFSWKIQIYYYSRSILDISSFCGHFEVNRSLEKVRFYRVPRHWPFVWQVSCLRWINMPQIWPRTTPTDPKYLQKRSYLKCLSPLPRKLLWIYMNNITNNHLKGQKLPTVSYSRHLRANYISSFWLKLLWLLNTRGSNFWSSKVCEGSSQVKHIHADSLLIKPIFSSKLNTT